MVDTTLTETTCAPSTRRLRVTLDLMVTISDISQERVRRHYTWNEADPASSWEGAQRQQRLLLALLGDERALHRFLVYVLTTDLDAKLGSELMKNERVEEEDDEILEAVYAGMGEADAGFFREVRSAGVLYESTQLVHESFVVDWQRTGLVNSSEAGEKVGKSDKE
jgi:hypothetical protein